MTAIPVAPRIYHITHVENLPGILEDGGLWSEAELSARGGPATSIGMEGIKARRLTLPVKCHPGDHVGEYVPFYFCSRSIMLYLIYRANHPNLAYRGGQGPILHLELDLHEVVAWANGEGRRWAFTLSNAGAVYAEFRGRIDQLGDVDWDAVRAVDFSPALVKEGKQAEFLLHGFAPWPLVRRIGVHSPIIQQRVIRALAGADHRPVVEVIPAWYY